MAHSAIRIPQSAIVTPQFFGVLGLVVLFRVPRSEFRIRDTAFFRRPAHETDTGRQRANRYCAPMDDRHAALLLAGLALAGAGVRYALAPASAAAPGDVQLAAIDTPPPRRLRETARTAARLARPLLPGERIDLDRADVTEITRLPRVGPALAQRIVAWRDQHGPFGSLARFDSVPGVGPRLVESLRPYVKFSGQIPPPP